MAIAFDTAVQSDANAVTNNTWSHTCTGSNLILFVGVQFATGTDISGVPTYNGVGMTLAGSSLALAGSTFNNMYLYYLLNPATGAHNVSINNTGGANYIYAISASYSGVDQVAGIDVNGTNTSNSTSTISSSITTSTDNDWLVGYFAYGSTAPSNVTAGSNTTIRINANSWNEFFDTNAAQTPAGSHSLNLNKGAVLGGIITTSIKPVVSSAALGHDGRFLSILGVGN